MVVELFLRGRLSCARSGAVELFPFVGSVESFPLWGRCRVPLVVVDVCPCTVVDNVSN